MGNVLGYMGTGETALIGFDAHIDTVGIGNIEKLGLSIHTKDMRTDDRDRRPRSYLTRCGGIVSAVYGAKIMKDLGLLSDKYHRSRNRNCPGGGLRRSLLAVHYQRRQGSPGIR